MLNGKQVIAYFDRLFHPRAIAIIGASDDPVRGSSGFLQALKELGFPKLYPVNPFVEQAMGLKCYPAIQDVPEEVDLAIIGVPRQLVPSALEDCIKKGVKFAHIFTAGFSETDRDEGIKLEYQLVNMAKGRIRLIGPNCMGIHCPSSRIGWAGHHKTVSGDVALISQSGGHASHFIELACEKAMGISKVISVGNSSDLKISDLLEYVLVDPETNIIGLYMKGLRKTKVGF
ncbi:MAG: CoA-binding protein, partial [Pseudomonadota bacterium]